MQNINSNYVLVEKVEPVKQEGFETVVVTDSFNYIGKIVKVPDVPVFVDNFRVGPGTVVMWAKYSPDTHEVDHEGKKLKFVRITDLLAVI